MSNNLTSEKLTFLELIKKFEIEIPIIQRDYAQGREGKEELRKNFLGALLDAVKGKELELDFVYGSVKDNVLQPLDGQQRLTTLFLLHWFVAVKENKLDDELKKLLIKFTYETRTSSREFCNELINKGIIYKPEQKISEQIIDSSWFFLSWKKDPTIKSMLTMLDDIQQTFKNETEIWEKLNNISFHFIELQNFGLSDDLYIKMNARGKALTDFENFKAKFEQYIKQNNWENSENPTETFSHKIDTVWTDLFWKYRDESENVFDEKILNFFRTMAVINYTLKADIKDDKFSDNIDLLRGDQKVSFNQYLDLGCFDEVYFKTIKSVLDKISDKNGLKKFLDDTTYLDEGEIFNGMIQKNLSYPDLVIAFAYYQYLASEENIEKENLKSWLRIIRNLVEGSRPYLFNNANEFANAISSVKNLFQHKNSIVKYFAETEKISLSGFIGEQVSEEKLKAKLITQSNDWKDVILEIENHGYFKGQIGFLLNWCKDENGIHNIEKFKEYVEKAEAVFDEKGLKNFGNYYLFERGLLATGDYLLTKGKNHSFLIDNDRDISWKRLLRDDNEKRKILKSLFDNIKAATLKEDLEKIVDDFSYKDDWRYYFIKQPEMIVACGSQKLIRLNNNNEYDILLLGSTTTSGYHKEYYSYSLFVELKEKLSLDENLYKYEDQRSVDDWKYFVLEDNQIAFDCKEKKYVWTQNNDWSNKNEFENRENAILKLTVGNL
jgi:hypothetical protein